MTIIDVSEWQGVIDWNKVKPQIDGAILRCGCGTTYNGTSYAAGNTILTSEVT